MKRQEEASRYVALDIHKHYVMVGAQDEEGQWVLRPRKMQMKTLEKWGQVYLRPTDEVVIESTSNAWVIYDALVPLVARVVVANPLKVRQITQAQVKTDKLDLARLLILLRADLVPEVWVPPAHVRELRGLISHRGRLKKQITMSKNRLQSVLHRLNLEVPEGGLFAEENRGWWTQEGFPITLQLQVAQDLYLLEELTRLKEVVDGELARLSNQEPWAEQAVYLMQLPGMGYVLTMTVLGAIGDITRFAHAKKLVGYAGLGAGVHDSGQKHQDKRITKAGRRDLRWALVEAARSAVRYDRHWEAVYQKMCGRMHKHKALVAVARKMLVVVWHVLTKQEARRAHDAESLARKMLRWGWEIGPAARAGMTSQQFAKYGLVRLGVGEALTRITYGKVARRIAPLEEVLALKPELKRAR